MAENVVPWGEWEAEELAAMQRLGGLLANILAESRFAPIVQAIGSTPVVPIADGRLLLVGNYWWRLDPDESPPREWGDIPPLPEANGAWQLERGRWTPLPAFVDRRGGEPIIFLDRRLSLERMLASWLHELIHIVYDEDGASEAEDEFGARSIELELLVAMERNFLFEFSFAEQIAEARLMKRYWRNRIRREC